MRPLRSALLLFSLVSHNCTSSSSSSKTHNLSHTERSYCNKSNYKISTKDISFSVSAAAVAASAAGTINKTINKNSNLINDDDDNELWQLYGHPAGDENIALNNSNKINENNIFCSSSIEINTKEDNLPFFTNTENRAKLNKETSVSWIDAIKAYEAECYAHPLEPSRHIRLNLLHSIEGALQLPCSRREREVCKLWKYALEVNNMAISHSSIAHHTQNNLHETCNEVRMLCNILYYSEEYVQCVALVHAHLTTLENYMEIYHNINENANCSRVIERSSNSSNYNNNDDISGYVELEEAREKNKEEQQQPSDLENKHNVKTILSLMEIVSVYLMSLSQHEPWIWEVRREEKEEEEEEYHHNDDHWEHVYMKTIEHNKEKEIVISQQPTSSKIQRVCQFAILLLKHANKLLHHDVTSKGENLMFAKGNVVTSDKNENSDTDTANNNLEKQITRYVIILVSAMEWLLFHNKKIINNNELISGEAALLQGVVSPKIIQEWRTVVHYFPFVPTCLLHENIKHERCININIYTNELINKTPLGIVQYVQQLSLTTWHDWMSLVHVFHYVLEQESTWPLYRIFALSITIGNKLISCNTSWINNLFKQQSVHTTRQFILSTLGTSIDVKALVHYGTLPVNKKKSINSVKVGGGGNIKCNPQRLEECKNANNNMDNINANAIHNNNSIALHNNRCLSIVCSMSGLEAYKGVQELLCHSASNEEWARIQETYGDILTGQKDHNWRTSLTRLQTQLAEGKSREWRSELAHTLRLLSDANKVHEFLSLIREYNMMESSNFIYNSNSTLKNHNLCVASSLAHVIERSGKWWYVHEVVSLIAHASLPQDEEEEYYLHNACVRSLQALAHAKKWKQAVQLHSSLQEIMPHEALDVLCSMLVAMPAFSSWRSVLRYITTLQHSHETICKIFANHKYKLTTSDNINNSNNNNCNSLNHYVLSSSSSSSYNVQMYHKESKTLEITKTNNTTDDLEEDEDDDEVFIQKSKLPEPYLTQLLAARGKVCVKEISDVQVRRRSLRLLSENGHWRCIYDYIATLTHKDTNNIHHHPEQEVIRSNNDNDKLINNTFTTHNKYVISLWSLLLFAFMHCDLIKLTEAINIFSKAPIYDLATNNLTWLQTVYVVALDHGWLPELLDMLTSTTYNNHTNEFTNKERTNNNNKKRSVIIHEKVMHSIREYIVLLKYILHGVLPEKTFVFTSTFVIHMLYSLIGACNFVIRVSLPYNFCKEIVEERTALNKQTVAQALHVSAVSVGALPTQDAITQSVINSHNNVDDAKKCSVSVFVSSSPSEHIDARSLIHITELKTYSESQHNNKEETYCEQPHYCESTMQTNKSNEIAENNNDMTKTTISSANKTTNTKQVVIIGYKPAAAEINNVARGLLHHVHHTKHFASSSSTKFHNCIFYTLYYLSPASHGLFVLCSSIVPRLRFEVTLTVRMCLSPITNVHVALLSASFYNKYCMNIICESESDSLVNTHANEEMWMEVNELNEVPHALCTDTNNNLQKKGNSSSSSSNSSSTVTVEATCTTCEVKSMNNVLHNLITDMNSEGWGLIEPDCGVGESLCISHVILRDRLNASNVIVTELNSSTSTNNYKEQLSRSSSE